MKKTGPKPVENLRVALAGVGGVGGYCARILHDCGVASLTVCDMDSFQPKNESYQFFASSPAVSRSKAETVGRVLGKRTGSPTRVNAFDGDLTDPRVVEKFMEGADLVISALDNFNAQAAVGRACESAEVPYAVISAMGFCVQHTLYSPDSVHGYSSAWKHFNRNSGRAPGGAPAPDMRRMMERQALLFAVLLAGYSDDAVREMVTAFRGGNPPRYWNCSSIVYTAAAFGVLDALKHLSASGEAAVFPEVLCWNMKGMYAFDGRRIIEGIGRLNGVWHQGTEAVMAYLRTWRGERGNDS